MIADAITVLPHDREAELRIAGNCIRYPEQFDKLTFGHADCYDDRAGALLEVMGRLRRECIPINHASELNDRLLAHRVFQGNIDALRTFLGEISDVGSIRSGFEHDCKRVAEFSLKRKLFDVADWMRHQSLNGQDPLSIMTDAHAAICDLQESGRSRSHFKLITARQLAEMDCQVDYRIPGVMPLKQPLIFGGPKKGMKTSVLCDAAISIASGGYFLGYFKVAIPGRVWFITGESGLATVKETANRICDAAGVRLADLDIIFTEDLPRFSNPEHMSDMGDIIARQDRDVVIADPAGKMMDGKDAGNLFAQYVQLEAFTKTCLDNGADPILTHHAKSNRAQPFAPLDLDDLSWSGFAEHFRSWILLNRREAFELGSGEHRLWMSLGGSAGHHGLYGVDINEGTNDASTGREWHVDVLSQTDIHEDATDRADRGRAAKQGKQIEKDVSTIMDAMVKLVDKTGTKTDIRDRTGLNSSRFNVAFATALQDGHVTDTTITKANKQTYDAYRLTS